MKKLVGSMKGSGLMLMKGLGFILWSILLRRWERRMKGLTGVMRVLALVLLTGVAFA